MDIHSEIETNDVEKTNNSFWSALKPGKNLLALWSDSPPPFMVNLPIPKKT